MEGEEISIIAYGAGVQRASNYIDKNGISGDILDLRSLISWDKEAVEQSVKKTWKMLILLEDCLGGGIGGEISAWTSENYFKYLDAPIMPVASLDRPVPFSSPLEDNFLLKNRLKDKIRELLEF